MATNNDSQMDDTIVDSNRTNLYSNEDHFFVALPLFVFSIMFYLQNGLIIPMSQLLATETISTTTTVSCIESTNTRMIII